MKPERLQANDAWTVLVVEDDAQVRTPLARYLEESYRTFAAYDSAGILLWCLGYMLVGRFFGDVLKQHPGALAWTAHFSALLFAIAVLGLLAFRIWKQQAFLKQVRTARLEPEELKRMLDSGNPVFIVDLRHPLDYLPDPRVLPGAVRLTPDKLVELSDEIPRDRDIILYCTCPSEATAAKMAMNLRKLGIYRVRPLRGGFDGDEGDDRAAEAAAGHAGAFCAGLDGGLDCLVGLRPGELEPVAERVVRGGQERAEGRLVAGPEQVGGFEDAALLGEDVPGHALQGRIAAEPG